MGLSLPVDALVSRLVPMLVPQRCLQCRQQVALTRGCDGHGAPVAAAHPPFGGKVLVDLVCQLASEMVAPLRPVQARIGIAPAWARCVGLQAQMGMVF